MKEPEILSVDSVNQHIIEIGTKDSEIAHQYESWLYTEFIKGIAQGKYSEEETIQVAQALLKSKELDFERWFA